MYGLTTQHFLRQLFHPTISCLNGGHLFSNSNIVALKGNEHHLVYVEETQLHFYASVMEQNNLISSEMNGGTGALRD